MTVTTSSVVTLHYTVSTHDGAELDSSVGGTPLTVLLGRGFLISGLESALIGKQTGEVFDVAVSPENAYGERLDGLVQRVPREMFGDIDVDVGMSFRASTEEGEQSVIVIETTDDEVVVDGNHPLAGVPLHFNVEIVSVRQPTADELAHGHAHGAGGCGH